MFHMSGVGASRLAIGLLLLLANEAFFFCSVPVYVSPLRQERAAIAVVGVLRINFSL